MKWQHHLAALYMIVYAEIVVSCFDGRCVTHMPLMLTLFSMLVRSLRMVVIMMMVRQ